MGPEHTGAAGLYKDPRDELLPDNAQLLNALQNVMVISTTDLQGNITAATCSARSPASPARN